MLISDYEDKRIYFDFDTLLNTTVLDSTRFEELKLWYCTIVDLLLLTYCITFWCAGGEFTNDLFWCEMLQYFTGDVLVFIYEYECVRFCVCVLQYYDEG